MRDEVVSRSRATRRVPSSAAAADGNFTADAAVRSGGGGEGGEGGGEAAEERGGDGTSRHRGSARQVLITALLLYLTFLHGAKYGRGHEFAAAGVGTWFPVLECERKFQTWK